MQNSARMGPTRRAAFSVSGERIAPVFDVAPQLLIVEADASRILRQSEETRSTDFPVQAALRLVELSIGALVCGAISGQTRTVMEAYGIRVCPFLTGSVCEVVDAWVAGELNCKAFAMPGCGEGAGAEEAANAGRAAAPRREAGAPKRPGRKIMRS
jgi:predicted Fe-Mo cluster-binding NifX family protein